MRRRFSSKGGRSGGSGPPLVFGIIWTAFSSIFVIAGVWMCLSEVRVRGWERVPCLIERFEITSSADEDPPFRPDVEFSYQHEGRNRTGTKLWRSKEGVADYEELSALREEMWSDMDLECFVDPDDPDRAVLVSDGSGIWGGLVFAAFGGGFVLIGAGLIASSVKGRRKGTAVSSDRTEEGMGGLLGCGFFGAFAVAGLGMLFGLVVPKAVSWLAMRSWVETPAEVVWSRVRSHSGDDGTTYSVDVFYKYEIRGREYRSNRWGVIGGSSSGRSGKKAVVDAHPPGHRFVCHVDPDEPWRAVVNRGIGWWGLIALFPLPFAAIGLGGLWSVFFRKPKEGRVTKARESGDRRLRRAFSEGGEAPKRSGTRRGRVLAFVGAVVVAVFWNGLVSVFLGVLWKGWQRGDQEWFLLVFLIPFVLVGLLLLLHVPYRLLAIFSPVYEFDWDEVELEPGSSRRLTWKRTGGGGRPVKFSIRLVGREEATYRRGSSTSTANSVFHESVLFETDRPLKMPSGACDLAIPADAVPSFSGKHNKVRWLLCLDAEVPWRPDVRDEHEIEIGPGKEEER